jgi:hypothetical protein
MNGTIRLPPLSADQAWAVVEVRESVLATIWETHHEAMLSDHRPDLDDELTLEDRGSDDIPF